MSTEETRTTFKNGDRVEWDWCKTFRGTYVRHEDGEHFVTSDYRGGNIISLHRTLCAPSLRLETAPAPTPDPCAACGKESCPSPSGNAKWRKQHPLCAECWLEPIEFTFAKIARRSQQAEAGKAEPKTCPSCGARECVSMHVYGDGTCDYCREWPETRRQTKPEPVKADPYQAGKLGTTDKEAMALSDAMTARSQATRDANYRKRVAALTLDLDSGPARRQAVRRDRMGRPVKFIDGTHPRGWPSQDWSDES